LPQREFSGIISIFAEIKNTVMTMRAITLRVPDSHSGAAFDYAIYLASKLYEDAEMSAGQAAEIAGLSKRAFIEIMGKYDVSPFSRRPDDLLSDIANA
jgi:predicted HTH domain antitoxin